MIAPLRPCGRRGASGYITKKPNCWATYAIKMTVTSTGAMYLIMTTNSFSDLNGPDNFTSSTTTFGFTIHPTNTHAIKAAIGIITEFEMKSRKSRMAVPSPNGWMNDSWL